MIVMDPEKKKVLIINDREKIRERIDVTLRDTEFEVVKATGRCEGIQIVELYGLKNHHDFMWEYWVNTFCQPI